MTKLEQEMFAAIDAVEPSPKGVISERDLAKAAAEVAKEHIKRAFTFATYLGAAHNTSLNPEAYELEMIKYLKENGIE